MAGQTIGGFFKDHARGEKVLAELQAANFSSAQISEVEEEDASKPEPKKLSNPLAE